MKYELSQKAYEIDFSKIEEGYLYSEMICFAENRNEAKTKLLKEAYWENICLKGNEEEVTYLTIPVIRRKSSDRFKFEDKEINLYQIEEILTERERILKLDEILNNTEILYCYIKKGGYYRPNSCGYTDHLHKAGVFPKSEAISHAKSVREIRIIPINIIEHNVMIEQEISELKTRVLEVVA